MSRSGRMVEVFADISCPFAHFSLRRFVEERSRAGAHHVRLRVRAWPLELVNGAPLGASKATAEIADLRAQVAPDLFRGFDASAFPTTTVAALGVATLAYDGGVDAGEAFNLAVRDALFEHGQPIAEPDVLAGIATRVGVTVPNATTARAAVAADLTDGRRRGVIGSPHYFFDGDGVFCPTLDIERAGSHLHVEIDHAAVDRFLADALR